MKEKQSSGFTLIETLVVMAITGILTAMSLGYTRQSGLQVVLFTEQAKVAGMLQRAKTLALQGLGRSEGSEGVCYGVMFHRPVTGLHFFTLFRNAVDAVSGKCIEGGASETILERQNFDSRVQIVGGTGSPSIVVFRGPIIKVFINGAVPSGDTDVVLQIRDDITKLQKVTIGAGGSISTRN